MLTQDSLRKKGYGSRIHCLPPFASAFSNFKFKAVSSETNNLPGGVSCCLVAGPKYLVPKIKEGKVYVTQFVEVSGHTGLSPKQGGVRQSTTVDGGGKQ